MQAAAQVADRQRGLSLQEMNTQGKGKPAPIHAGMHPRVPEAEQGARSTEQGTGAKASAHSMPFHSTPFPTDGQMEGQTDG